MCDRAFVYTCNPARVIFGRGTTARLPEEAERLGASELGMPETGVDKAADSALANPHWKPRLLEREAIAALIARAHAGEKPLVEGRKST